MQRPGVEQISCLDLKKCMEFIEEMLGKDLRDYDNAFEERKKSPENRKKVRLLDFWEAVAKRYDVKDGSVFDMNVEAWMIDIRAPSWEREIARYINDYFHSFKSETGNIKFIVRWK